jgi:hypothetical protein
MASLPASISRTDKRMSRTNVAREPERHINHHIRRRGGSKSASQGW